MRTYSSERKEGILKQLLPPFNKSYMELSKEEGIPHSTIYTWNKVRGKAGKMEINKVKSGACLSAEARFSVIVETATMSETEISQYCREKGFYPEQIKAWKNEFITGMSGKSTSSQEEKAEIKKYKKLISQLEKDLNRKDKALAEAAALLILRKKLQAFYEEGNEDD